MIKVTKGNLITNICFYFSNKGSRNIKVQPWGLGSWHHRATDPSSDAEISGAVAEAAGPSHCTCLSMPLTNEIRALRQWNYWPKIKKAGDKVTLNAACCYFPGESSGRPIITRPAHSLARCPGYPHTSGTPALREEIPGCNSRMRTPSLVFLNDLLKSQSQLSSGGQRRLRTRLRCCQWTRPQASLPYWCHPQDSLLSQAANAMMSADHIRSVHFVLSKSRLKGTRPSSFKEAVCPSDAPIYPNSNPKLGRFISYFSFQFGGNI